MCVLPQLRFLGWESRAILSACFVAPGAFIFFALIIYIFYCRYPPPIRSNGRDPGHGAVTAASKKGESRSSRAVRSPPGRLSRVFSHSQGEGGTGVSPRSHHLVHVSLVRREEGTRAIPGRRRQVLGGQGRTRGRPAAHTLPGGLSFLGSAGDTSASLGREGAGGSPPSSGDFFLRGRRQKAVRARGKEWSSIHSAGMCWLQECKVWQVNV